MSVKSFIRVLVRKAVSFKMVLYYKRFYSKILSMNSIPDRKAEGEDEWIGKWSVLGNARALYYRCFSHYIGPDMNIVPEDLCRNVIEPCLNPRMYVPYYSDKNVFDRLFPAGTCPRAVLRKIAGTYYDHDYSCLMIENDAVLFDVLNSGRTDVICVKPSIFTGSGVGIDFYERKNGTWVSLSSGSELTLEHLDRRYKNDFIIQERLSQSQEMGFFNPTSVNTLRLTLYRSVKTNECVVPSAILRIGGKGSLVDNAHAGGAYVGIREDGSLCDRALDQYGRTDTVFNGIDFTKGYKIRDWDRIIDFARETGRRIPHLRLLALDIMIDSSGNPRLVEFNSVDYSMWLFQFTTHGAFGEYTDEIIQYCRDNAGKNPLFIKI